MTELAEAVDDGWDDIDTVVKALRQAAEDAEALCTISDLFGVELHPAGTGQRLQEIEARPDTGAIDYGKVRETVPECDGMPDARIDAFAAALLSHSTGLCYAKAWDAVHHYRLMSYTHETNERGREVLAAIEACRVEPAAAQPTPEPGPDLAPDAPEGLGDAAIGALIMMSGLPREEADLAMDARASLLARGDIKELEPGCNTFILTQEGAARARRFIAKLRGAEPEPSSDPQPTEPPTPEPEWSEPISQMSWQRCRTVAELLGASLTTYRLCNGRYGYRAVPMRSISPQMDTGRGTWEAEITAARCGLNDIAVRLGRYANTNRIRLDGLEAKISE
jgi:hypothetical protein